jgi:hypothetical protein
MSSLSVGTLVVITACKPESCLNGRYGFVVLTMSSDMKSSFVRVKLISDGREVVIKDSNLVKFNVDLQSMIIREVSQK